MQFTIDQHTPSFIWIDVIRTFLEKTAGNNFGESIEIRFVGTPELRLIRQASNDHFTLQDVDLPEHRLMNIPFGNRLTVTNAVEHVEQGLRAFVDQSECKLLIIEFRKAEIRLHLCKADDGLAAAWVEIYNEEFHRRETVPSIKITTPPNT